MCFQEIVIVTFSTKEDNILCYPTKDKQLLLFTFQFHPYFQLSFAAISMGMGVCTVVQINTYRYEKRD